MTIPGIPSTSFGILFSPEEKCIFNALLSEITISPDELSKTSKMTKKSIKTSSSNNSFPLMYNGAEKTIAAAVMNLRTYVFNRKCRMELTNSN